MNKFFIFAIFISNIVIGLPIQNRKIDPVALNHLLDTFGISNDENIVDETQKKWLRRPNQERWKVSEIPLDQKLYVLKWATEQGFFSSWEPALKNYDKALILGATTCRMQKRINYLKQLWENGIRFNEIVWLTGERPLDRSIDLFTDRCQTESEAANIIWNETPLPKEMKDLSIVFISVPMRLENGFQKRPNTEDTIIAWLKQSPEPCKTLFISDQPFCGYQFSVVKSVLPNDFSFDVVGEGVDPNEHPAAAAITLDSLARWLYQEKVISDKENNSD